MSASVINRLRRRARRSGDSKARAAAIVEFAVVLPLLTAILFGIIEYGYVFMVRLTLENAAREACRVAVLQTSREPYTNVTQRVNDVMQPTGLTSFTITMTHATPSDPSESVTVSIPYADVSLVGGFFGTHSYDLTGKCTMRKEGMSDSDEDEG